ncbi:LacI family DNA-binding transcriptional regulator [Streptomyces sp. JNUCC 64]
MNPHDDAVPTGPVPRRTSEPGTTNPTSGAPRYPKRGAVASRTSAAPPTSAAVANRAGVSRATVSYVLNGLSEGRVSEATQARVRAAAEELGYVPHAAARTLRSGHSGLVLIAVPADRAPAFGPLFAGFLAHFQTALQELGYTAVLHGGPLGRGPEAVARAWAESRPAAVLAAPGAPLTPASVEILKRSGVRTVLTLGSPPVPGTHGVVLDQEEIGAVAARHLLRTGRRRIGVVMPEERGPGLFAAPRLAGVRAVASAYQDAEVRPLDLAYTEESAYRLAVGWRASGLDAVFAYNDEYAMLLMRALMDEGVVLPADTSVVGAGDLLIASLLRPRLTSVHVDVPPGDRVANLVDRLIREPRTAPAVHWRSTARLVPRESSAVRIARMEN